MQTNKGSQVQERECDRGRRGGVCTLRLAPDVQTSEGDGNDYLKYEKERERGIL